MINQIPQSDLFMTYDSVEEFFDYIQILPREQRSTAYTFAMLAFNVAHKLASEENTRWNSMYKKMMEYKAKYGHCDIKRNPMRTSKSRKEVTTGLEDLGVLSALGSWTGQVRLEARRPAGRPDRIEPYKIIALNRLGFDWQPRENYWMDMYEQLKVYLKENEGKMPPRTINCEKNPLGVWCDTQLDNWRKFCSGRKGAYITQEKIDMLNEIG